MNSLSFPKNARLLRPGDYGRVFDNVQIKVPHRHFLVLASANELGRPRLGLIFAKKNLKHAVQRNRVKRLVRESFRQHPDLPAVDIIVLGRQGLAGIENAKLHAILDELWQRLRRKSLASNQPAPPVNAQTRNSGTA
ncbi:MULTISPECIES: ribonuclease P protein component [Marinobacter]|uniref:Ribonuclease P protein component n=1 Tax=Marinobacter xestospongiae TaxID=994319 RepID=A0ABU3VZC0_9GAMM|nr:MULTISPECIES: ribonuclease P protein component [Marinobacter]MCG8520239.1 ribonuclease P protein component [Pseudomonadales bacterium]MDV2079638.1 ribonuclease P protein component [Marinobacter xestospongiae]UDL05034.1 ribonuclease P protein component [Marinobacter sp. CA1]